MHGHREVGLHFLHNLYSASRLTLPTPQATLLMDANERIISIKAIEDEIERTGNCTLIAKGSTGLHLLGLISQAHSGLEDEAVRFFELAVRLDPFLFEARERIAIANARKDGSRTASNSFHDVLTSFEESSYLLAAYRCDETLECLSRLPAEQQKSAYALGQQGRAYFEKSEYAAACSSFERMRAVDPNRAEGLEVYSTALWHLKRDVQLAYLARDAADRCPKSPQTWCVVGNCFSLEKEHDLAIRFFRRALQLDESFTYAYTLAGHEYVANEDFEKATANYRHAMRTDGSHYMAWWGLGTIYQRQEKYDLAEFHFRKAISIHQNSSILYCFLGMVLHASERNEEALQALDLAKRLQPNNPNARYQRAQVLVSQENWLEALDELEFVRDAAPNIASVHMLIGQVCKSLNRRNQAMIHFVAALDLEGKESSSKVQAAIDDLGETGSMIHAPTQGDFDVE